jgi:outer membrane lipoprotein-sorting protein
MNILRALFCIFALLGVSFAEEGSPLHPANGITAKQIVTRMTENNRKRKQELQSYTGQREYHLLYTGFPGKREADLVVEVKYEAPTRKEFRVISESGSQWMINRVFKRLLETEKEAADEKNQERTALTEDNYEFELLGQEVADGRPSYVLRVEPKTANKLLYRGKIWVDATDYALSKIEGEPAKLPSFWISKTIVHHSYRKIGDFWLPARNESNTEVRLGGHAILSIQYRDYKVVAQTNSPDARSPGELSIEDVIAIIY